MGTNYYLREKNPRAASWMTPHELHIGKSSQGWCFALHVYPDNEGRPSDWDEWLELLRSTEVSIFNEYGDKIDLKDLIHTVEERRGRPDHTEMRDYFKDNGAILGPHHLLRPKAREGQHHDTLPIDEASDLLGADDEYATAEQQFWDQIDPPVNCVVCKGSETCPGWDPANTSPSANCEACHGASCPTGGHCVLCLDDDGDTPTRTYP